MADVKFVDGMRVSRNERAPEWVIATLGLKREQLIAWLEAQDGEWVNVDIKRSQGGKLYAAVNERRPARGFDSDGHDESGIPF
jgi:hypothetical protein